MIDKFAGYGFNKSHAAAYALVAYQTAWLKAHHRAEFYAASMSFDMAQTDKLALFVEDMRRGGRRVPAARHQRQPRLLHGRERPEGTASATRSARSRASARRRWKRWSRSASGDGPFASLEDFAARIDPRLLNRRQLESLAGAGAFDGIKPDRAAVFAAAETILAHAASAHDQRTSGQAGLFGADPAEAAPIRLPRDASWTLAQRMAAERDAFGFYFSAHPVDAQRHLLAAHKVKTFAELAEMRDRRGRARSARPWRRWSRMRAGARRPGAAAT